MKNTEEKYNAPVRIILIEDDATIRDGYAYLLGEVEDFDIAGTYSSYEDASTKITDAYPDIILLDIQLPGLSGIDAIVKLKQLLPHVIIIILTVHEDPDLIFKALTNGAAGYLTKNISSKRIVEAIYEAVHGGGPLSANVARIVIESFKRNQDSPLTNRESEILQLIADGKSRSIIANELYIDLETVKTHIKNIYTKLNVHSRADAIKTARESKYIR